MQSLTVNVSDLLNFGKKFPVDTPTTHQLIHSCFTKIQLLAAIYKILKIVHHFNFAIAQMKTSKANVEIMYLQAVTFISENQSHDCKSLFSHHLLVCL